MRSWPTLALFLCLSLRVAAADALREDINPALLYWQAFAAMPDLAADEQKHLLETQWRTRPMDERAGELASRFDGTFRLLRSAVRAKPPCDWGIDMSAGPEALLPHLAKAKRCATVAVLRARWAVQQGRPEAAKEDLAAAFFLGRNVSRDGTLISTLVQIAIERIVLGYLAQQWAELPTDTMGSLLAAVDSSPARGTMAASMETERVALYGWLVRAVQGIQSRNAADEPKALQEASKLLDGIVSDEGGAQRTGYGAKVIQSAGGTMAGLVAYVRELEPLYDELEQVMALPYADFQPAIERFQQRVAESPNLLTREFVPALLKARDREFRAITWLAMVHAAYQLRLDPAHGLEKVQDPFGNGPFGYSRFVLDGVDRGFKLKSEVRNPDFPEVLIFVERPGPAFLVDGPRAGEKVQ